MANMLPPDWRRDPVGAGILLAAATAEAEWLKATSLTIPGGRPPGGWVGDPITSGYYSDGQTWGSGWRSNGAFDYARAVGDPSLNAIVDACIGAIASAFPEPPVRLYRPDAEGEPEALGDALPAVRLLRRPNPVHTWEELAGLIVAHEHVEGNAYLGKVRSAGGRVVELWPLPPDKVTPVPGGRTTNYVDHFAYKADDREPPQRLPPSEVVHLTLRRDPKQPWRGRSPLTSVLKHIFGDEEATAFMNAMLKNYGVPGALLTPDPAKGGVQLQMTQEQADKIKSRWMAATGGDRRGEPVVLASPMSVAVLGFNPQQLQLSDAQLTPEARICAALGVPPIVALQRVGLQNATYCLPAGARVWTPQGSTRIADVTTGQIVWSFVDGRLEPRRVVRAGKTGHKALYEVKTKNRTLRATGNHPVLVRVAGRIGRPGSGAPGVTTEWRRVDELHAGPPKAAAALGDHLVQVKALPDQGGTVLPDGTPATAPLLQFLGALVGDGTVDRFGVRMAMPAADRCAKTYRELAESLFTQRGGRPVVTHEDGRSFRFGSRTVGAQLASLAWGFGGRAKTKRVPAWVYALSRPLRLAFLAGLVDSDGSIDRRGCLALGFANEALTHDARDLLISVGIQCSNVGYRTLGPEALPNPGTQERYEFWSFVAASAAQVAAIPFSDPVYRERVEANPHRIGGDGGRVSGALSDDLGFYRIIGIRELPAEDVYDLEVEGGHSFIADGIVVHNSNADQFYEGFTKFKMVPYWRLTAAQLTHQLLPDFVGEDSDLYYEHDLSEVGALQEDETALYDRITKAVGGPWMTLNDGRRKANLPELPEGDVILLPSTVTPTEPDALIPEPPPEPAPPVAGLLEAPAGGANGALPAPAPQAAAPQQQNGRAR